MRAEVLPNEGGNGDAKGADNHPEEAVQLAIGRPGSHHIRAEAIDAALDHQV